MHVSIAHMWCDPKSGACELGRPTEQVEFSKHFVEKLSANWVQVARCDVERQVVFVVFDLARAALDASARTTVIESLMRREKSLVAVVNAWDTARCTVTVVPTGSGANRALAAQAAAVVQASWGWDESEEIEVTVDNEVIEVRPRDGADGWSADVRRR
jgi:hypothetical protein